MQKLITIIFGWILILILAEMFEILQPVFSFVIFFIKHIWTILLIVFIFMVLVIVCACRKDYLKYKNETPQERAERLKTEQMLVDWRKQFK